MMPSASNRNAPQSRPQPVGEILPPGTQPTSTRWNRGGQMLGDERLQWLEILLDEAFVIPGTRIRFGIDGIIGLIPGLGDVLAGLLSLLIPLAAWVRGVAYVTLARMLINVAIGLLVGSVPILGDAFDISWKANRRNYRLLTRSVAQPKRNTWKDWAFLIGLGLILTAIFAIPIAVILWILAQLNPFRPMH